MAALPPLADDPATFQELIGQRGGGWWREQKRLAAVKGAAQVIIELLTQGADETGLANTRLAGEQDHLAAFALPGLLPAVEQQRESRVRARRAA